MKYLSRFLSVMAILIVPAAILLVLTHESPSSGPVFSRIHFPNLELDERRFHINRRIDRLYYKRKNGEGYFQHIPTVDGIPFYLNGERSFPFTPEIFGDIRLYSYIDFQTVMKRRRVKLFLERVSGEKVEVIFQAEYGRMSQPLFLDVSVARGDRLQFRFQGNALGFFSRPIVYARQPAEKRRHIFLIGLDTMRGDLIGARVNGRSLTPHLDALIKDSVYFPRTYAQSSWTIPSFVSMFTAAYEFRHNVDIKHTLQPDFPHLVRNLSEDFVTFALHGGSGLNRRWGYGRGFDSYKEVFEARLVPPNWGQVLFGEAVRLLNRARFPSLFLFLHTYQVHSPYRPPLEYLRRINKNPLHTWHKAISHGDNREAFLPVAEELEESLLELYQAEILAFDAYFGEFIAELKRQGLYENALIIFMSDHGEEFFEHGGWYHSQSLYDELIRVPLIFKFPGSRYRGRFEQTVGVIDILPTILGYYGKSVPENIDGEDLMAVIAGKRTAPKRKYLFSSVATSRFIRAIPPRLAVLFDRYKLIYNYPFSESDLGFFPLQAQPPRPETIELYDLMNDAGETNNIASQQPRMVKKITTGKGCRALKQTA